MTGGAPLAHSAPDEGRSPHSYADHIGGMVAIALARADAVAAHMRDPERAARFVRAVVDGATYHDLGKLDPENQMALRQGRSGRMPWDHVDAGVAHLMKHDAGSAAWIVHAHHAPGLPAVARHARGERRLRGGRHADENRIDALIARTDGMMARLIASHDEAVGSRDVRSGKAEHGLFLRMALSCLVDGDHSDTARYEHGREPVEPPAPRWEERLARLDEHVASLPRGGRRQADRDRFFRACRDGPVDEAMVACEGPVGIGKTTAVTAWLLRRAIAAGARRLFVVAPFTAILSQTARTLRAALILPDEAGREEEVVAENHHRAEFAAPGSRELAVLWRAPIVVTTGVQFFETIAACEPSRLRKLNGLAGAVVFLDEAHAAVPTPLWRQQWAWLRELARDWGCSFVFASGSLARAWEHADLVGEGAATHLPALADPGLVQHLACAEHDRVRYRTLGRIDALDREIAAKPGPRLVILNTVQSAAVMADRMRRDGMDVLHLSSALCPDDRSAILEEVHRRLIDTTATDWTLVATSLVEAGVDLSFRTAFRERFSTASLIQTGGRVNRHGQDDHGEVYDFQINPDELLRHYPGASRSAQVLHEFFQAKVFDGPIDAADVVTAALLREAREEDGTSGQSLSRAEGAGDYPGVAELARLIEEGGRLAIVKPALAHKLATGAPVSSRELLGGSVSILHRRVDLFGLEPLPHRGGLYLWRHEYDPGFLGYMAGALRFLTKDAVFL